MIAGRLPGSVYRLVYVMALAVVTAGAMSFWFHPPDIVTTVVLGIAAHIVYRERIASRHKLYNTPLGILVVGSAVLVGPSGGFVVALMGNAGLVLAAMRVQGAREQVVGAVFNLLMICLMGMTSGWLVAWLTPTLAGADPFAQVVVLTVSAAFLHDIVNIALVALPLSLTSPVGYVQSIRRAADPTVLSFPENLAGALLLTTLWGPAGLGFVGLLLVTVPLAVRVWSVGQLTAEEREQESALLSFGLATEMHDPHGEGASERVWETCRAMLGQRPDIPPSMATHLRLACGMRDVGLISSLNPAVTGRVRILNDHPEASLDSVSSLAFLGEAREIIAAHHERHDGRGYPRGLRGEEIPVGAQILSVAGAFCALTSGVNALSPERALAELQVRSGSAYAGSAVFALRRALDHGWTPPPAPPGHGDSVMVQHCHPALSDDLADQTVAATP